MKKKSGSLLKSYGPVKLYLDDLFELESVFKAFNQRVTIETDRFEFDSVQELIDQSHEDVLFELEIETYTPHIRLSFDTFQVQLYAGSDEHAALGAVHRIEALLKRTERKPSFMYRYPVLLVGGIAGGSSLAAPAIPLGIKGLMLFSLGGWWCWASYIQLKRMSVITLKRRSEHKTFWARHFDQLTAPLLVAAITAIATWACTTYGASLWKLILKLAQR